MQAVLQRTHARRFFEGPGRDNYNLTSPNAPHRHEVCVICYEALSSADSDNQQILLTHIHCLETVHAVCLMDCMEPSPNRCPYCRQVLANAGPYASNMQQFGELVLSEPNREMFSDSEEAIAALERYSNILDDLLGMFEVEQHFILRDDELLDQISPPSAIELWTRVQRDELRALAMDQPRDEKIATDMLIAFLHADPMLDLSWLSRTALFSDMQEWFNLYSRERYQLTIGAFLLL